GRLGRPSPPSFTRHIYPVLSRAGGYAWVSRFGHDGHGPRRPGDFAAQWSELADPEGRRLNRKRIVDRLRDPNQPPPVSMPERSMPRLHDETNSSRVLPPTRAQYAMLLDWVAGNFVNDWQADLPEEPVPEALTRYALESCSGGAFFPGIEAGRIMKDAAIYAQPFRIDRAAVDPGGLTAGNAVPWQADFAACEFEDHARIGWWPAQRPDEVFTEPDLGPPSEWADGAETFDTMAANWHRLGVVRGHVRGDGTTVFLEQERSLPRPE
ncbi:MAG TPA: LodA/GoxA family CTQ-dependent oxidase, partial [Acidimicrobiales bacterium]|nr:LodA/GoxA family CTQ-dependent oxidase [Acidimicrobiales bacterium]